MRSILPSPRTLMAIALLVIVGIGVILFLIVTSGGVTDFQSCKNAGGRIVESYPEQCFMHDKSFIDNGQSSKDGGFVGLTEQAALTKAKSAGLSARVVERDGKPLAVTMDFVVGRLNFHVKSGVVYLVDIEGQD